MLRTPLRESSSRLNFGSAWCQQREASRQQRAEPERACDPPSDRASARLRVMARAVSQVVEGSADPPRSRNEGTEATTRLLAWLFGNLRSGVFRRSSGHLPS